MQPHQFDHITGKAEAIERIGDAEIYREIALVFNENLPNYMTQLDEAMRERDCSTFKRLAHSIKSNCATIGADNLRVFFAAMEQSADQVLEEELATSLPQALKFLSELRHNLDNLK